MQNLRSLIVAKDWRSCFRQTFTQNTKRCLCTIEYPPAVSPVTSPTIPEGVYGQPTCYTHPHMIPKGQLTCGITQAEYKERRETLVNKLVSEVENNYKNHIVVIPAAGKQFMSDKIPYVFRQNSDFFYLTGCLEPSAILVMVKPAQTESFKSTLFVSEKDPHKELWEGPRTGVGDAPRLFAVDEARPLAHFDCFLTQHAENPSVLWYQNEEPANPDLQLSIRSLLYPNSQVTLASPQTALHFMRVVKSPAEVALMRDACYTGAQSVNTAMAVTKPGVSEHAISAVLEYSARQAGAEHAAFPPVVGGGARATHIHYVANNQLLRGHEMLLVDSGCQRAMYNSDISRVWPVSGKFSNYHRVLYEIVLSVQKRLITILGEHRPPLDRLFEHMCRLLGSTLQAEGILDRSLDSDRIVAEAYRLCPHHVSHYLGIDVHDAALVRRAIPLQENMIVTVEPGLYIQADDDTIAREFRGVGIRIEDDVLVTERGVDVLTDTCVKEVSDIEAIVGKHAL